MNLQYHYRENGTGSFHITIRKLNGRYKYLYILGKERHVKDFYNCRETCGDFTIISNNGSYKLHSLFLQMYGKPLFIEGSKELNLNYSGSIIEIFIRYIYFGSRHILEEYADKSDDLKFNIKELLEFAHVYHITELFDVGIRLIDFYTNYEILAELCKIYPENIKKKI